MNVRAAQYLVFSWTLILGTNLIVTSVYRQETYSNSLTYYYHLNSYFPKIIH